jgi:hypothetical protein
MGVDRAFDTLTAMGSTFHRLAIAWCICALSWCGIGLAQSAASASIATRAQEAGCSNKPTVVEGSMFKCITSSGNAAYFNVPGVDGGSSQRARATSSTPAGFPRVDADTQRGRDGLRRKVLSDELDTEEKLLVEARAAYGDGAPPPLPDEQKDAQKYANRLAKLRQTVSLHEKNIEALRKELAALK